MKTKRATRNPYVALAKFRQAGAHTKPTKSVRRQDKQALAQAAKQWPKSWQERIASPFAVAMALA